MRGAGLRTPRAPVRIWVETLKRIAPVLSNSDANDVVLFGSQAMSIYTRRALASKDLDLLVPGITIRVLEDLCDEFTDAAGKRPVYDFTVGQYSGRRYPVGHIYLRHGSGYPLVVEFFQTFLGFESRRLTPFLRFKQKWGINIQVFSPEAIIGTRLSFRPPERVTKFNAVRLSRFIRTLGKSVDWLVVNSFLDAFQLRAVAVENIEELRAKRISIPGSSNVLAAATSDQDRSEG